MEQRTGTRTQGVMNAIRERLRTGSLGSGDRLPSIRGFAAAMRVSPSTVVEAYDRLAAEGLIRPRPGSGFYACASPAPLTFAPAMRVEESAVDPFLVSRLSLDGQEEREKPGCGWLPHDWMPTSVLRRAMRQAARGSDAALTGYGATRGSPGLRRQLARRFADEGLPAGPDNILLTPSGTQAIDLVCRLLLKPGDAVLLDDPCYFNFRALLAAHRVRAVPVPHTPTGPDPERFAELCARETPRLYLTNSALHNPTGATLLPHVAHRILTLAGAHGVTIVEDDIFADFEPEPSVRLASLDGLARVVRVGSFSKTLSASVRCGYVAARPDWIEALVDLQVATNFAGPSPLAAAIIETALLGGSYRKHMEEVRGRLARARREVAGKLQALGIAPWLMPRGGFYLWCELPTGIKAEHVAKAALAHGVVLAPGEIFGLSDRASGFMRFNVAQMREKHTWDVLERALATGSDVEGEGREKVQREAHA